MTNFKKMLKKVSAGKENIWQTFLDKLTKELPVNENFFKNAEKGK